MTMLPSSARRGVSGAALIPMLSLVPPVILIEAANVNHDHLATTLAPFIVGLLLTFSGLALAK
jgi:hypothetical protein